MKFCHFLKVSKSLVLSGSDPLDDLGWFVEDGLCRKLEIGAKSDKEKDYSKTLTRPSNLNSFNQGKWRIIPSLAFFDVNARGRIH